MTLKSQIGVGCNFACKEVEKNDKIASFISMYWNLQNYYVYNIL